MRLLSRTGFESLADIDSVSARQDGKTMISISGGYIYSMCCRSTFIVSHVDNISGLQLPHSMEPATVLFKSVCHLSLILGPIFGS